MDLAVRVLLLTPRCNHVLTSLGVTQMNEHVKRCFILDDFQQITIRRWVSLVINIFSSLAKRLLQRILHPLQRLAPVADTVFLLHRELC